MTDLPRKANAKPRYGWDAPGVMLAMLGIGGALVASGLGLVHWAPFAFAAILGGMLAAAGAVPLVLGLMMLQYGLGGKLRTRDAMLALIDWRGDERVLDVGAGAGLLLVGAAKRLTRGGRAIGIDIWSAKDLSDNTEQATRRNIALEGVADRAEIETCDATSLHFADGSFDVVVSLLCLHNIEHRPDQARACREIARVLKPGGRVVIGDYVPTHAYAAALSEAGLHVRRSSSAISVACSLMWFLVADKPQSAEPNRRAGSACSHSIVPGSLEVESWSVMTKRGNRFLSLNHATTKNWSMMAIQRNVIML